jgi:hypothetical protein
MLTFFEGYQILVTQMDLNLENVLSHAVLSVK